MIGKGYIKYSLERFVCERDKVAFFLYNGKKVDKVTYKEFVDDILKVAGFFCQNKVTQKHIAFVEPNSYKWIVTFFAALSTGNIAVLLDPLLPQEIIKKQCELADVTYIYNTQYKFENAQMKEEILDDEILNGASAITMDEIYCESPDDTIILIGTSGTTGTSKMVEISSKNIEYSVYSFEEIYNKEGREKLMASFPWHHIGGLLDVLIMLYYAKSMCIGRGAKYLFADMSVLNPTSVSMVPAFMESLEKIFRTQKSIEARRKYVGENLKRVVIAGATIKQSTCRFFLDQDIILETAYGMTETTRNGMWCELSENNPKTVGKITGEMQCKILDGELLVKGPTIMKGYYKDPEATNQIIKDGWLHTGDLGYCDEEGYYYITGRKKNVIILSNGENVNPEEIEATFYQCDKIVEAMVYSDGKGICADIFTENEHQVKEYVKAYNENMPLYRQVYKVNCTNIPLEKTAAGKIKRKENLYAK